VVGDLARRTCRTPDQSTQPRSVPAAAAILYEKEPGEPTGKRFPGFVHWRVDKQPGANAGTAETVVKARVEVPERGMVLAATFGRNRDKSLPASHTIELTFRLPEGFARGGIANVPGILMKDSETTRGVPLAGASVKVTPAYFLIGLSATDADHARNMRLLKDLAWFDLPIVYGDKRRAILAFAKGEDGERAFGYAFGAWNDDTAPPASAGGASPAPGDGDSPPPSGGMKARPQSK
jgi:hypothetical protein